MTHSSQEPGPGTSVEPRAQSPLARWLPTSAAADSDDRRRRRLPVWVWALLGVVALLVAFLLAPVIVPLSLAVLVTGIIGWSRGARTWLRFRSKQVAIGVTAAAAAMLLVSGSVMAGVASQTGNVEAALSSDRGNIRVDDREDRDHRESAAPRETATPTPTPVVREEIATEAIPYESSTVDDPNLPSGQTATRTAGQPGERTLTYRITELDGEEIGRELISDVVTVEPVAEVIANGTYVAPPPPPPAPEPAPAPAPACDPNYADACVPVASDVDCAWGSGNGPAYFDGVARVVGSDIYDLDRDGDGLACEQ